MIASLAPVFGNSGLGVGVEGVFGVGVVGVVGTSLHLLKSVVCFDSLYSSFLISRSSFLSITQIVILAGASLQSFGFVEYLLLSNSDFLISTYFLVLMSQT